MATDRPCATSATRPATALALSTAVPPGLQDESNVAIFDAKAISELSPERQGPLAGVVQAMARMSQLAQARRGEAEAQTARIA